MYNAEYHKQYYQEHKGQKRLQAQAWEKANPEKVQAARARTSEKIKNDPERRALATLQKRVWEQKNPEAVLFRAARNRAKKDGMAFSITLEDIKIPPVCPLLGIPIAPRRGGHGPQDASPSLDRKDNKQGYVKENVWVVSWLANKMKTTASTEQLLVFAHNIQVLFGSKANRPRVD